MTMRHAVNQRWVLLAALVLAVPAFASLDDEFTAEEKAVLAELDGRHFIKARRAAEELLTKHPESFVGAWAMARVHHDEEGNHARSLFYLARAEELLNWRDDTWGRLLLLERFDVLFEMARNADALSVLEDYEDRYGPPPSNLPIWPLFKLGRFEEAEERAMRLSASKDVQDRIWGYNGLLSIAFERHDRAAAYKWAMEGVRATDGKSCTVLLNAGGTAFTNFRFPEAEELMLRADSATDCTATPYDQIAVLAILQGEPQKALSALKKKRRVEKRYRPQFALVRREVLCDLLGSLGKEVEAAKLSNELYRQPARTGMTSSPPQVERLRRTMRHAYALDGLVRRLSEKASYGPRVSGLAKVSPELTSTVATRWEVRRTLLQLLSDSDRLLLVVRPNLSDVGDFGAWRTSDLIDVIGPGVMRAAIAKARAQDGTAAPVGAYFDAFEAELELRDGNEAQAVALATRALEGLPKEEALMRWRTQALRAVAYREDGNDQAARADFELLMRQWPTIFRVLDVRVPASLSHDNAELSSDVASRLSRSRRFDIEDNAPFKLRVDAQGSGVTICLTDTAGSRLTCSSGDTADAALDTFHSDAFSPKISLTDGDLRSLDGSPVRVTADEALKKVLEP